MIVTPLAFTRAAVDPAYTKLDLMDKEAVAGFFQTHNVKGTHPQVGFELTIQPSFIVSYYIPVSS
jgi:hypothetical protein